LARVVFDHHPDRVIGVKHQRPRQTTPHRLPTSIGGRKVIGGVEDRSGCELFAHQQPARFGLIGLVDGAVQFAMMTGVFGRVPLIERVSDSGAIRDDPGTVAAHPRINRGHQVRIPRRILGKADDGQIQFGRGHHRVR
jgi:hypothetical protein